MLLLIAVVQDQDVNRLLTALLEKDTAQLNWPALEGSFAKEIPRC